jgi:hypothetical protein
LEQQVVAGHVGGAEGDHGAGELAHRGAGIGGVVTLGNLGPQSPISVGEQLVVEVVLRLEVGVQRGLAQPDSLGQLTEGHPGHAVVARSD